MLKDVIIVIGLFVSIIGAGFFLHAVNTMDNNEGLIGTIIIAIGATCMVVPTLPWKKKSQKK